MGEGVLLKPTIFFRPDGECGAERAGSNSHCNNGAVVYVVRMEGTNDNAGVVSRQLSYLSSSYFCNVHPVFTNLAILVFRWLPH